MNPSTFRSFVTATDALIKQGKTSDAQKLLSSLRGPFPPSSLAEIAALSCRAFIPRIGIRVLYPIVYPSKKAPATATDLEKAEYARCLIRFGASEEALRLLETVNAKSCPEALFYQASAHTKQWGYERAIPLLSEYLKAPQPDAYQTLVVKVNLAAALVYERRHSEAAPLLRALVDESPPEDFRLLHMNVLHTQALDALYRGDWHEAREYLDSEAQYAQSGSMEHFFSRKWYAILGFLQDSRSKKAVRELDSVIKEAIQLGHWETWRDCDRFRFLGTQDRSLFLRLYFGTPFESFRKWLTRSLLSEIAIPDSYDFAIGDEGGPVLDLWSGKGSNGKELLKVGQLLHRMLSTLVSDFYSPARLAPLHFRLHPGEHYNPNTSPHRMHRALQRFRLWTKKERLPIQIEERDGAYRLVSLRPIAIRVPRPSQSTIKRNPIIEQLRVRWPMESFTALAAAKTACCSKKSIARALQIEIENGGLEKLGAGNNTEYRFNKK